MGTLEGSRLINSSRKVHLYYLVFCRAKLFKKIAYFAHNCSGNPDFSSSLSLFTPRSQTKNRK